MNEAIGMVGLANKPNGFTEEDIEFLKPFVLTCTNIILSRRNRDERLMYVFPH